MARPRPQSPAVVFHSVMPRRMSRPGAFSAIILRQLLDVRFHGRQVVAAVVVRADVVEVLAGVLRAGPATGRRP